jgi:beta-N-acetylhexosaminidase
VKGAVEAVVAAVGEGRLTEERIDASLRRVLVLKARAGLHKGRKVDLNAIGAVVGNQSHLAFADTVAERSITLPRDRDELVPIDTSRVKHVLSLVFGRREDPVAGRAFRASVAPYFQRVDEAWASYEAQPAYDSLAVLADSADLVLVSVYVGPRSGSGTVAVAPATLDFVNAVIESGKPTILLSFGNPYLLTEMPNVGTYLLVWGGREVSERAAARALLGQSAIIGRLPISIPPFHRVGEGLQRLTRTGEDQ